MRSKMFRFAFMKSSPIVVSYLFLGIAAGVLLVGRGYAPYWPSIAALLIYGGSMQIAMVPMLSAGMPLWMLALMTLLINGRYLFYGISFVDSFRKMGWRYPYMVLSITDETYSVQCALDCPKEFNEHNTRILIQIICHSSWIIGNTLGGILGSALPFDLSGIEFTATALFVVIAVDQWMQLKSHIPAVIGLVTGVGFFILLGPDNFILPALCCSVLALVVMKDRVRSKMGGESHE